MKKGVILQDRDFEILRLVYEDTVTPFDRLKKKSFAQVNFQTASNRLGRLCQGGYLRKYRAGLMIYQGTPRQIQLLFTVTPQGIQTLKFRYPQAVHRTESVPLNSHTLIHDLLLNEVMDQLKAENPRSQNVPIPDAIQKLDKDSSEIAIELELTVKSERRYREIVTSYRLTPRFRKVLFIYSNNSVVNQMAKAAGVSPPENRTDPIQFSKFEFRRLESFLEKGEKPHAASEEPDAA